MSIFVDLEKLDEAREKCPQIYEEIENFTYIMGYFYKNNVYIGRKKTGKVISSYDKKDG